MYFKYYSLDITKVDGKTNQPIDPMALFKVWLPDEQNTVVYAETSQTDKGPGKLDYCFIERDKDYTVRLSKMLKPKDEGTEKYYPHCRKVQRVQKGFRHRKRSKRNAGCRRT